MEPSIIVGIDIGTSKICTLVGHLDREERLRIIGVGIEPSQGIKKGNVVDLVFKLKPACTNTEN